LPRTMRGKAPRSALDLFGYFLGQLPKSNRLAAGETKLCTSTNDKIKMDSGFRRNDEPRQETMANVTGRRRQDEAEAKSPSEKQIRSRTACATVQRSPGMDGIST